MDATIILAQILGILFAAIGLATAINRKTVAATIEEMSRNQGFLWLFGFIALVIGATIIVLNDAWTSGLTLLITIMGWLALFKGIFILFFPKATAMLYKKCNTGAVLVLGGFAAFILGLVLLYWASL
jgi:uncharacterized protein YjeT (DUF2065 family)